ncbi:hypothetical protein ODZ84_00960 [Chryseobacterium fluminis]|uniref:hypothetical protein n=1 Tax=Chryseobacterium fluminis TaxID=2983606 RepID=UPI00225B84BC|nr:hypothetical protein [Chryseobacterium sp. MMS21-Ot14]UZT98172.1 hypothetical protein ODZ84_00960 [Chryseobacterium sp. MMS21-Ot14]
MKYFFLTLFFVFTSCISDENLKLQSNSKFQGNYMGNFNGGLSGEIKFNVSDTGNIEGTVYYTALNTSEGLSGYVMISGKFDASTKTGLSFSGYLNDKSMNGKWTKGNLNGNYDFYKK